MRLINPANLTVQKKATKSQELQEMLLNSPYLDMSVIVNKNATSKLMGYLQN